MDNQINITYGNDHRLRLAMTRWDAPLALSQSSDVRAFAIDRYGRRTQLVTLYSSHDEGVAEVEWTSKLKYGCYSLEIMGTIEDEGQWRMCAACAVVVTPDTRQGGESVSLEADSFDVKGTITVCEGTKGVTEELRQEIADMIEEEYNASERVRESNENDRQAAELERQEAEVTRNEAELGRANAETLRAEAETKREQDAAAAIGAAERVNATLDGTILTVTDRNGEATSVDTKGERGERGETGERGERGEKGDAGLDGAPIYPRFSVTENMHLVSTDSSNRISVDSRGHLVVDYS